MKKFILFAAILFAGVSVVKADGPTASADATLNVRLYPLQTIVVNPAQNNINLDYVTVANYNDGVSSLQADHLKIYSTGAFIVQVASANNDITRAGGTETISASTIKVKAEEGTTNPLTGQTMAEVGLSTTPTNLINSGTGGVDKNFNITYSGLDLNGYVNNYFNDENPTVYSTTVTYTIAAQ
ncbi:MAG: hypothetical protein WDA68_11605 [Phycisphaerae bacterium]